MLFSRTWGGKECLHLSIVWKPRSITGFEDKPGMVLTITSVHTHGNTCMQKYMYEDNMCVRMHMYICNGMNFNFCTLCY